MDYFAFWGSTLNYGSRLNTLGWFFRLVVCVYVVGLVMMIVFIMLFLNVRYREVCDGCVMKFFWV